MRSRNNMSFEDVLKRQTKSPKELEKENIDWFVEVAAKHFQNSCLAKAHAGKYSHFEYAECGEVICSYSKKLICTTDLCTMIPIMKSMAEAI